jgi:hypothetical protein
LEIKDKLSMDISYLEVSPPHSPTYTKKEKKKNNVYEETD